MDTTIKTKQKTVYGLRIRLTDADPWGETGWYRTAKKRNDTASMNRIIGGLRTWSFDERKTIEEIEELDFD